MPYPSFRDAPVLLLALALLLSGCARCQPSNGDDDLDPGLTDQVQVVLGRAVAFGSLSPVEGAKVRLGEIEATTDASGRFAIRTRAAERPRSVSVRAEGLASAERLLPSGGGAIRDLGPIVLHSLDGSVSIGKDGGRIDLDEAGVFIEVPRGAFKEQVEIGVSRIPVGDPLLDSRILPAPVPQPAGGHSAILFALVVDSGGVQPAKEIGVRMRTYPLPEGTLVPIGRFDSARGRWVDAGSAISQGDSLSFSLSHLSTFGAALPALPVDETAAPLTSSLERSVSPFMPGDPRIDPRSGAMQIGVPLPGLIRRGDEYSLSIFFDSRTVLPAVRVPVVAADAAGGETLIAQVVSPTQSSSLGIRVEQGADAKVAPVAIVEAPRIDAPSEVMTEEGPEALPALEITSGTEVAEVLLSREGEGVLAQSASGSFAEPRPGPPLSGPDGELIPAPGPIEHRSVEQVAVAIDNRGESPFGAGWHLSGLTRLIQPWCGVDLVTLAGETDWPALSFGQVSDLIIRPLSEVFAEVDIDEEELAGARLASSGGMIFVALQMRDEVWRLEADGSGPVRIAGGGSGTVTPGTGSGVDLKLPGLVTVAGGPRGEGILIATEHFITHLKPDGSAVRVVGTAESCDGGLNDEIKPGESALNSRICFGMSFTLAADPTSDRFVFGVLAAGSFEVDGGTLNHLRAKEGAGPHWHNAAFDRHGRLYYSSDLGDCIYLHVDGLVDEEVFPRCRESDVDGPEDGPAEEAVARGARAITFDRDGSLWFIDNQWNTLRRYRPDGELVTVSARADGDAFMWATPSGGVLSDTALGFIESIVVPESGRVFMGGQWPADLVTTAPIAPDTFVSMGSGDGSVLRRLESGGFLRVTESGIVEYYDERGLLESRGRPGEPPLEYRYRGEWQRAREVEVCGLPEQPPMLDRIVLSGETLWRFDYDPSGKLSRITDAAQRSTSRSSSGGSGDTFRLACGSTVVVSYDAVGMVQEKRSPGPGGNPDLLRFEWEERRLLAVTNPGGRRREVAAAEESVKVPQSSFDGLRIARDVSASIPVAEVPTRSGETARVTVGTAGVLVESPAGDTAELQTDRFGRLLRVVLPDGSPLRLARDEAGRILSVVDEAGGDAWSYRYAKVAEGASDDPNVRERLVERRDHRQRRTLFRYDARGMLSSRVDPGGGVTRMQNVQQGAARGLPEVVTDQEGRVYEVVYDGFGNITRMSVRDADDPSIRLSTTIERDSAGRAVKVTEPSGKTVLTEYDVWGEPTRVILGDPSEGHEVVIDRASSAAWTNGGAQVPVSPVLGATDGEGRSWTNRFVPGWRLSETNHPASGRTAETYGEEGRITERAIADGSREEFEYDEAGRLLERRWIGPATGSVAAFVYDEHDRVVELTGSLVEEHREFSPGLGWTRLDVYPRSTSAPEAGFNMSRRRWGEARAQELGADRFVVRRGFDDKVESLRFDAAAALTIEYDRSRKVTGIVRGNGTQTIVNRDSLGRVVRQEEVTPSRTIVMSWTWDADRPSSFTIDGARRDYSYDSFGRLISCSDTGETYTYDLADGRAAGGAREYSRDLAGRLTSDDVYRYEHDQLGRRTLRVGLDDPSDRTAYVYGPGGRLASVMEGSSGAEVETAAYSYDSAGRRITKTTAEGTWHYGYLPESDRLVRVLEPDGVDGVEWHLFHALPAAAWSVASSSDGKRRWTHLDPLDRVIGVSDESGELWLMEEGCFGQRLGGGDIAGPSIGFHGMPYDEETGLYYAGARYYDPLVGAFLTVDPMGLDAAPSIYDYAGGNPVIAMDPSGRLFFVAAGALLVGGLVFNEIRKVAQSDDVRRARRGYEAMTDSGEDDTSLSIAEKAHQQLATASRRGGATAVESTVKAVQAGLNPAGNWNDLGEAAKDLAESVMDSSDGGYYEYGDD